MNNFERPSFLIYRDVTSSYWGTNWKQATNLQKVTSAPPSNTVEPLGGKARCFSTTFPTKLCAATLWYSSSHRRPGYSLAEQPHSGASWTKKPTPTSWQIFIVIPADKWKRVTRLEKATLQLSVGARLDSGTMLVMNSKRVTTEARMLIPPDVMLREKSVWKHRYGQRKGVIYTQYTVFGLY